MTRKIAYITACYAKKEKFYFPAKNRKKQGKRPCTAPAAGLDYIFSNVLTISLLHDPVHFNTEVICEQFYRSRLHGYPFESSGDRDFMNPKFFSYFRIAQTFFQSFFLQNFNVVHSPLTFFCITI